MGDGIDYESLARGVEQFREAVNALVQGLITDGFTDREARYITAGMFAMKVSEEEEEESPYEQ